MGRLLGWIVLPRREYGASVMGKKKKQKFEMGDLVRVKTIDSKIYSGEKAIVYGSYRDQFGYGDTDEYTLLFKDGNRCSWYNEGDLDLLQSERFDIFKKWKKKH